MIRNMIMIIDAKIRSGRLNSSLLCTMMVIAMAVAFLSSCSNDPEIEITMGEPVKISATKTSVELSQKLANATAFEVRWTTGTNMGTGAAIYYTLEMDRVGNNFAFPLQFNMGKKVFSRSFLHEEINGLLLDFFDMEPETTGAFEMRIIATAASEHVAEDISEEIEITLSTFSPISATLYMIGSATPNGDAVNNALPMEAVQGSPGTFRFRGELLAGELKFITTLGAQLPSYVKGADDNTLVYRTSEEQPDNAFLLPDDGNYEITINIIDLVISIEMYTAITFDELYILGDATPAGWIIASPLPMTRSTENPSIFTWQGDLKAGEMKFPGFTGEWCDGDWINAKVPDASISATGYIVTHGCEGPDNKWRVLASEAGNYIITIDLENETIIFQKQ